MSTTNNDPKVVAGYYLRSVELNKGNYYNKTMLSISNSALPVLGVPRIVRCDMGTENSTIAFLQPFLRQDINSFRYGASVSNQVQVIYIKYHISFDKFNNTEN